MTGTNEQRSPKADATLQGTEQLLSWVVDKWLNRITILIGFVGLMAIGTGSLVDPWGKCAHLRNVFARMIETPLRIEILKPSGGSVPPNSKVDVVGRCNDLSRIPYIYVFARDTSSNHWILAEKVMVQGNQWAARISLGGFSPGAKVEIQVRGSSRADLYRLPTSLFEPPPHGHVGENAVFLSIEGS